VRSDYRPIDDGADLIVLQLQLLEYQEPNPTVRPVGEPIVDRLPWTKPFRQIAPRHTSFRTVKDSIDEVSISEFGLRPLPRLRKHLSEPRPLFIGQCVAMHRKLGSRLRSWHKLSTEN
jgi:hypothetical protein